MSADNLWLERLPPIDDAYIINATRHIPRPIKGLNEMEVEEACLRLESSFDKLFIPTKQTVKTIKRILGSSRAHVKHTYSNKKKFLEGCYTRSVPLPIFVAPICLTGLAGIGKSKVIEAIKRLMGVDGEVIVDNHHAPFPLSSGWYIDIRENSTLSNMLKSLLKLKTVHNQFSSEKETRKDIDKLLKLCRKRAYQSSVPFVVLDEVQFRTRSDNANAVVSNMIMRLSTIGVPFVFISNYSLCHRLARRTSEDRQRLLGNHCVLLPDPPDSECWISTLEAYRNIAPDIFTFNPAIDAPIIYEWTSGLKRLLKNILKIAYRRARDTGTSVGISEIQWAYMSIDYCMNREDVGLINQQYVTETCARKDLWCPFELPKSEYARLRAAAKKEGMKKMAKSMLEDSLNHDERTSYEALKQACMNSTGKAEIVNLKRKTKVINKDLKEGSEFLKNLLLNKHD